ncbi:MAG: MBOAT family protein [Leptospiraceae bacterium]|nr:MBOAT family protein [Leptospiraceae bacterium]
MFFNSIPFLIFFFITYVVYWHVNGSARRYVLIIASLVFYAYWSVPFLLHFSCAVAVNYLALLRIRKQPGTKSAKIWLIAILAANLLNLAFFKYAVAVVELLADVSGSTFLAHALRTPELILPLAISFYTFQMMALAVDAYRNEVQERISFLDYALFIFFFPQLIAGPIMRHSDFFYQIENAVLTDRRLRVGLYLIAFGLIKKSVVADGIAAIIDPVYADPSHFNATANLAAMLGFALQLYLDFSGYTDMARGVARLLGYDIPENFLGPYFASSFSEHWRRWHVTLSTWLRDYLYIPLGGSQGGRLLMYRNLFITMTLGGLWHGHDFTYLLWGMLEGTYLVVERALGWQRRVLRSLSAKLPAILLVFLCTAIARVFFRADSFSQALDVFYAIGTWQAGAEPEGMGGFVRLFALGWLLHTMQYYRHVLAAPLLKYGRIVLPGLAIALLFIFARLEHPGVSFIYFQF